MIISKNLGCICEYVDSFVSYCDTLPEDHCGFGMLSNTLMYVKEANGYHSHQKAFLPLLTPVIPILKLMRVAEMYM